MWYFMMKVVSPGMLLLLHVDVELRVLLGYLGCTSYVKGHGYEPGCYVRSHHIEGSYCESTMTTSVLACIILVVYWQFDASGLTVALRVG
jgi:hypothetical protein